ncbi:MAG: DUF2849 domain-containing protein [Alphaproteobacteria bacterium]|nr:DUF2849 domain-containing protein [Alphaproteobacteria bacterium]
MVLQVFTANRVCDGIVVFLAEDGNWTTSLEECRVIGDGGALKQAMATAEKAAEYAVVADPYLIDVIEENDAIRPIRYRERIRAYGPPIHPDFAKQAIPAATGL